MNIEGMTEKEKAQWAWEQAGNVTDVLFENIRESINDDAMMERYAELIKDERYEDAKDIADNYPDLFADDHS